MSPRRWPNGFKLLVAPWDWETDTRPIAQMEIKTDVSKAIRGQKGPGDVEWPVGWMWGGRWMNWWTDHWTQQTKTDGGRGRAWKANASADTPVPFKAVRNYPDEWTGTFRHMLVWYVANSYSWCRCTPLSLHHTAGSCRWKPNIDVLDMWEMEASNFYHHFTTVPQQMVRLLRFFYHCSQ